MSHVYDWARGRGYWVRAGSDVAPTHLLLDGGKLAVPDESNGAFLNAYACSVARHPDRRPCLVEVRTKVFKMFLDLDTRFASEERALAAAALGPDMLGALRAIHGAVSAMCPSRALVCASTAPKRDPRDGTFKLGFHVVWPDVLLTRGTALRVRDVMVQAVGSCAVDGLACAWDAALDPVVFRSSGLRMPWSGKGRDDDRTYELRGTLSPDGQFEAVTIRGVSALRQALLDLSIRTFGRDPTVTGPEADDDEDDPQRQPWVSKTLGAYADVLPALDAALPLQFAGQKFTGLVATEHCYMLRSTARYCFNLGRQHRTNNVYFLLTRRGVCQRCYCRCDTAEGRKYGACKDFSSEAWPVPAEVLTAFFGEEQSNEGADSSPAASSARSSVAVMPSRAGKSFLDFDSLVARSAASRAARSSTARRTRGGVRK
jgi:hypothetical protein